MPDVELPAPQVRFQGDAGQSPLATAMCQAFYAAVHGQSRLPPRLFEVEGFSGRKFRMFLNNLCAKVDRPRYLEIGVFKGGSFLPAIYGNAMAATALDNWSWPRSNFGMFNDYLAELSGGVAVTLLNLITVPWISAPLAISTCSSTMDRMTRRTSATA